MLIHLLQAFEFYFNSHLMKSVLVITYELSKALQIKNQDIMNTMKLVEFLKQHLQAIRKDCRHSLFEKVSIFCAKNNIIIPNMDDLYQLQS